MAIGEITVAAKGGHAPATPTFIDVISFEGDDDYPSGGTAFKTAFEAAVGASREILAVIDVGAAAGHYLAYDKENEKLLAFVRTTGVEAAEDADLSDTTFQVAVISV